MGSERVNQVPNALILGALKSGTPLCIEIFPQPPLYRCTGNVPWFAVPVYR